MRTHPDQPLERDWNVWLPQKHGPLCVTVTQGAESLWFYSMCCYCQLWVMERREFPLSLSLPFPLTPPFAYSICVCANGQAQGNPAECVLWFVFEGCCRVTATPLLCLGELWIARKSMAHSFPAARLIAELCISSCSPTALLSSHPASLHCSLCNPHL